MPNKMDIKEYKRLRNIKLFGGRTHDQELKELEEKDVNYKAARTNYNAIPVGKRRKYHEPTSNFAATLRKDEDFRNENFIAGELSKGRTITPDFENALVESFDQLEAEKRGE